MAYPKRVWIDGPNEWATYEDFNRIEGGISDNDENIASQGQQLSILSGGDIKNASEIGITDADNLPVGWYSGNLSNSPNNDWYAYHTFYKLGASYRTQIAYGINTNRWYMRIYLSGSYQKWIFFGDDYREILDSDLRNGFKVRPGLACYLSRSGNNVVLNLLMVAPVAGAGVVVAQIPDGWKPLTSAGCTGSFGVNSKTFNGELTPDGVLRFWDLSSGGFSEGELVRFSIAYRAEG